MRTSKRGVLRTAAVACAVAALLLLGTLPALADGNGAQTSTVTIKNAVVPFGSSVNPCSGATGTLTGTSVNGVMHETTNKAGDFWDTGTITGTFQFVPDDSAQPTYTGHGETWFGDSDNKQNEVNHFTFHFHGTGTDGSTVDFHETGHVNSNANGIPVVSFDKQSATCG